MQANGAADAGRLQHFRQIANQPVRNIHARTGVMAQNMGQRESRLGV